MEFVSTQKYLLGSPRKLREVVYLIKNMTPEAAVEKLPFTGKRSAGDLRKVILTAIANAKQKGVNAQDLVFKEILVNEGPRLKRFQAGARGRAKPYKKRMSHIRVVLKTKDEKSVNQNAKKADIQPTGKDAVISENTKKTNDKKEIKADKK